MTKKPTGCLAVALLLTGMVLAGCIGSEAGGGPQADNSTEPADDVEQNQNTTDTDSGLDDTNATEDEGGEEKSYRVPSDAMSADPTETANGMAHFVIEGSAGPSAPQCFIACPPAQPVHVTQTYQIDNPGDVTFIDAYLHHEKSDVDVTDYDLYVYNSSGAEVAHSASPGAQEYVFFQPTMGQNETYTVEVNAWLNTESSYTLETWVWTNPEWSAKHPWTDVFEKQYEWGQLEACVPQVGCLSGVIGAGDPAGATSDGRIDTGGFIWSACGTNGGGSALLPCPQDPYTKVSVVINDDVAGQQVAALWTTCSVDGDIYCGETNNVNDTDNPGPNELTATFCGVINGLTRDGTTDKDGTGPGVWDQRDEMYETANGTYEEHPGVEDMVVFLVGPQRGGGGICPDANPYTGPTQGTITIIAQK